MMKQTTLRRNSGSNTEELENEHGLCNCANKDIITIKNTIGDVQQVQQIEKYRYEDNLDIKSINAIRCLSIDLPQNANSGHPGAALGCACIAHALFRYSMNFYPDDPNWMNRDRFILSNGHACALYYVMLYLCGYDLSIDDLKGFRRLKQKAPGHPEYGVTPGVEVCTGPLGQGLANGVGMAIASHNLSKNYNRSNYEIFDNFIYVLCGDGCIQEGVTAEACSLAGHLGLGRLIVLYDDNEITIDGHVSLAFSEDVMMRFKSYNWHVLEVKDNGYSYKEIIDAIQKAKECTDKPSLIKITTTIGFGSILSGNEKSHGSPLGNDEVSRIKSKFGFDPKKSFFVPVDVLQFYRKVKTDSGSKYLAWNNMLNQYKEIYPSLYFELMRRHEKRFSDEIIPDLLNFSFKSKNKATRAYSGDVLNFLSTKLPELIGGSSDLTVSNNCQLTNEGDFQKNNYQNRYIRFGVREHAMVAIANGLYAYGGFMPFCASFLNFFSYAWGAIRMTAMSKFPILFIGTHDSIELGEDGPSHQPIENIALIRATPNIFAIRPSDENETLGAYVLWLSSRTTPCFILLSRSPLPSLDSTNAYFTYKYGGYVVKDFNSSTSNDKLKKIIIGSSGSELHMCIEAREILMKDGFDIRVVSMPCWEIFNQRDDKYKDDVLLLNKRKKGEICSVYVEASSIFGWEKYFDFHVGMSTFGLSANRQDLWEHFGFTKEAIASQIEVFYGNEVKCEFSTHDI